MKKKLVKLSEGDLRKIVNESVKKVLKESSYVGENYYEYENII